MTSKEAWVRAMSLDPFTGLDPEGYKVRAAQGLDAATAFMPGYCEYSFSLHSYSELVLTTLWEIGIWQKVIENLAVLNYDHDDLSMHSYDWRLAYYNLEVRDRYFSRLKSAIEFNLQINDKKTVLISHSMGSTVLLVCFRFPAHLTLTDWKLTDHTLASQWFFKWVESPVYGKGGDDWVDKHVSDWINVAGTLLGVPKAMSALVSGEMRGGDSFHSSLFRVFAELRRFPTRTDTVEVNIAGAYLLEKFFSRSDRAKLFRSWAGAVSFAFFALGRSFTDCQLLRMIGFDDAERW